jgi:hypothetical protein
MWLKVMLAEFEHLGGSISYDLCARLPFDR